MDATRYNKAIFKVLKQWFDVVAVKFQKHNYITENI